MSLNFSFTDIKDVVNTCFQEYNPETDRGTHRQVTETLIFATMPVGINRITEDNYELFFTRLTLVYWSIAQKVPEGVTLEEVKKHIGLSTNASRLTDAAFKKARWDHMMHEASWKTKLAAKALAKQEEEAQA